MSSATPPQSASGVNAEPAIISAWCGPFAATTVGMVAIIVLSAFESLAVATAMPVVAKDLGGLSLYATAFAATLASGVIGMTIAGIWADRRGPRAPLLISLGFFVAGLLIAGLAPSMVVLIGGRIVQGLGSGGSLVALYVLVARVYPERLRPQVFAAFAAAWVVPGIVGPALAGVVTDHLGWRWVFLFVPVLAVPATFALRRALTDPAITRGTDDDPDSPPTPPEIVSGRRGLHRLFTRHTIWASVIAGTGVLLLHQGGQQSGPTMIPWLAVGLIALAVTVPALLPPGTLTVRRGMPTAIAMRGLTAAAFAGTETFLPLLLQTHRGLSVSASGIMLTAGTVTWALGSWVRGRTVRRPDWHLITLGSVGLVVGIAGAALLIWPWCPLWLGFLGWGFAGFGMGVAMPTVSMLVLRASPPAQQGANSSSLQVIDGVGTATILAISGALFAVLNGPESSVSFVASFAMCAVVAVLAVAVAPRTRGV